MLIMCPVCKGYKICGCNPHIQLLTAYLQLYMAAASSLQAADLSFDVFLLRKDSKFITAGQNAAKMQPKRCSSIQQTRIASSISWPQRAAEYGTAAKDSEYLSPSV